VTLATGLAQHLERPLARGHAPAGAHTGAAGGAACGDLIRVSLALDTDSPDGRILDAGYDASGCGATIAAGSAVVALLRDTSLLEAALIAPETIVEELGGLIPAKRHAAELAADALHRALGVALRQANLAPVAERTLVAMSGGVDSAVAALLIAGGGEETVAVTLELWSDPANDGDLSCCSAQAVRGARALAHELGVPHFSIDLRAEFRAGVVEPWLSEHAAGLTPNPCVRCNGSVRLDAMLDLATRLGSRTLATGHYARIERDEPALGPLLRMAADPAKDQSYALSALSPDSLARLRFPLGELTKSEVRARAERAGLPVARRRDSQDLCFLAGTRRTDFLARHGSLSKNSGPILDRDGQLLGEHAGIHTVTVGQRRGLGAGPGLDRAGEPLYVLGTDRASNTVTVGLRDELLARTVRVRDTTLHRDGERVDAIKVRYRGARLPCRLAASAEAGEHAAIEVELRDPAERTAPGQIACLYEGDLIVGHGTII
jgi:tRNA-uridine 2-sulfurtransferase